MMQKANLLILDEPTNHLDIDSKEVLEAALMDYPGTILFVSHDRYFINRITDQVAEMSQDGIKVYLGDYDYYLEKLEEEAELARLSEVKEQKPQTDEKRLSYKEEKQLRSEKRKKERRIAELETLIEEKELEIAALERGNDETRSVSKSRKSFGIDKASGRIATAGKYPHGRMDKLTRRLKEWITSFISNKKAAHKISVLLYCCSII